MKELGHTEESRPRQLLHRPRPNWRNPVRLTTPKFWGLCLAVFALAFAAQPAKAGFTASSGNLKAQADFTYSGSTLTVTLSNTATVAPSAPADVLTAIYINYAGTTSSLAFTAVGMGNSAAIATATANYGLNPNNVDVGGEWAFKSNITVQGNTPFTYGLSSTGLDIFGGGDRFNTNNIEGPDSPDGVQWGIVSTNYVGGSGNGGMTSGFVKGTATFKFINSTGFNINQITGVRFQYGTALTEPYINGTQDGNNTTGGTAIAVPAPAGFVLLASALPVFGLRRLIRRKRTA